MEGRSQYEEESLAAMSKVLGFIQANLDEPLTPHQLADIAFFSPHHFHRVFRAVVGESVMDHIRRLRLEKAAYRLKTSHDSIGAIGLDAGYVAQESFTRTFQAYFGIGPRMFRYSHGPHVLPSVSGIHYSAAGYTPLRRAVAPELLDDSGICPAHRNEAAACRDPLDRLLNIITGFHFAELSAPARYQPENDMNNPINDFDKEIDDLLAEVELAKQRLADARKRRPKEAIDDYVLKDVDGHDVKLSDLFAGKEDLIMIHNMGADCIYCTVWADGITGLVPHISDRASLVLCSPDKPEVQKRFAAKRNWSFRMVSSEDGAFPKAMGFWQEEGPNSGPWPGVSLFKKEADGSIYRVGKTHLGPSDDFCAVWPLFEMLDGGAKGWEPKYSYGGS